MFIIDTKHKNPLNYMSILPALDTHQERNNILRPLKNSQNIVVGSFAFNQQMPLTIHQKRPLTDIDIKSQQPRKLALTIERSLDKSVGFNNYYISILKHDSGRTFRIHSRARNTVVADISHKDKRIPYRILDNVRYETIAHREQEIKRLIRNPKTKYRREKDLRMMGYINRYYDSDNDGIPNWRDCAPFDANKTGVFHRITQKFRNLGSAGNVQNRKEYLREHSQQQYIQHGISGMGNQLSSMRPQNYHLSHDTIDNRAELVRRLETIRINQLMQQGLNPFEASTMAENELNNDYEKYSYSPSGRILWKRYVPLRKEMIFCPPCNVGIG